MVAVFEEVDDVTVRHKKRVETITLAERLDLVAGHLEVVSARSLLDIAGDGASRDHEDIGSVALVHRTHGDATQNGCCIVTCAEVHNKCACSFERSILIRSRRKFTAVKKVPKIMPAASVST